MRQATMILIAALAGLSSPAVAAKFVLNVIPSPSQTARMQDGIAAVDDHGSISSARLVQPGETIKKRSSVQILVMNQGDRSFNFGSENVRAQLADGTPVEIIGYDRLVKEEKRRQTWRRVAAGFAAASNSMAASNAGYSSGTATYTGNSYGSFGSTPFHSTTYGTATYSGYNNAAAQVAQASAQQQNQAMFETMTAANASRLQSLTANMRTTTVDPGQMFGGSVMFELPPGVRSSKTDVPMTFILTTGGEEHRFDTILRKK